jgi:hypothetical protein
VSGTRPLTVALLYPGDRGMRDRSDPAESRFAALFAAFGAAGVRAEPAVWHDDFADEVAAQLRRVDAVLVWCNPIEDGRRRDRLDTLLGDVARDGVLVSTHPDTILRLGTKDVLVDTRDLPFGCDVQRVDSLDQLATGLPGRLANGPRVLKQHRGHSGIGVWKVEWDDPVRRTVRLRHARRGSEEETVDWPTLLVRLAPYFEPANGGHMIDQSWQPRLAEGMVRAYLVGDRVGGFGHQAINALFPDRPGDPPTPVGPRLYHGSDDDRFQDLKRRLESGWIDALCGHVGVSSERVPLLWDCDFILGEHDPDEPERYVLCEVNVSSVSPFPPSAIAPLVAAVRERVRRQAL